MTIRNSPPTPVEGEEWPGDLRRPERPITADYYFRLPEGPPYYELIEGNLVLKWYTGSEDLRLPSRPVSAELFLEIPEGPPYYQLIEGIVVMSPSPSFYHQKIAGYLYQQIINYLDDHPMGVAIVSPCDVRLEANTVFHPDIFFVRKENARVTIERIVEGPPDLVIEVLSPSNAREDREFKRKAYARAGVEEMWIVDPKAKAIEVHLLAQGEDVAPQVVCEPMPFSPAMFPGLQIDTAKLFKPLV